LTQALLLTCRLGKNENAAMQGKRKQSIWQAAYFVSICTVALRLQNNALICTRGNSKGPESYLSDPP